LNARVLIVQRSLRPPGGGNAVAAWMVHALADRYDVTTLTAREWSVRETNSFYGTSIPDRIARLVVPAPWRWLSGLPEEKLSRLRMCSVLRSARALAPTFDLLITADNYAPFAKPGLQYLHFPADLHPSPARLKPVVDIYFRLCDRIVGAPWMDAAKNITLANSRWTAAGLERLGEMSKPIVLYPPVIDPGVGLPWEQRDDVFLCIGRFHGSKRIEMAISIVQKIRAAALANSRLIIIGSPVDTEYTTRIHGIASRAGNWIEFRENVSRAELSALMGRSRYGIQAMEHEHFGMATAEMTRAGCVVFAHRSGGTPEVLDDEGALLWSSEDEAVDRFARWIANGEHGLPPHVAERARSFSAERFVDEFRGIVAMSAGGSQDR
jgi:glycosyltransferase involved in cell wall biosynthesis